MKNYIYKNRIKTLRIIIILFLVFLFFDKTNAQSNSVTTITYQNETLRELAQKYLANPNYWETILRYNNFESASEFKQGMRIKIPTGIVLSTDKKIVEVKNKINATNSSGAKILTPELISKAENNFNEVLIFKGQGEWQTAYDTLQDALSFAIESFNQVQLLRQISADAIISFAKGDVERRKSSEKTWNEAELFSKLYEADRARTLSNSVAEITFIDLSRIRLNENSQALIQHSRIDVLKNKTETKVKLIKGDAFAYLMKSPKKKFDIDVPGLEAIINSKSFWIEKEVAKTKIANYEGEIELTAKNVVVVVKENQGSVIPDGGIPSEPLNLLPPPELVSPESMKKLYKNNIEFNWAKVTNAKKYWIEIALDASFKKLVYSNKGVVNTSISVNNLEPNVFYWRVCSIDKLGLPGEFGNYNHIMIAKDITNPFLIVFSPPNLQAIKSEVIFVKGESEPGLKLQINNSIVDVDESGKFNYELHLAEGSNKIIILSTDENGNKTKILRTLFYESSKVVENEVLNKNYFSSNNTFITNSSKFIFRGKTRPLSNIIFSYNGRGYTTYADTNGFYTSIIDVENVGSRLMLKITTPAGYLFTSKYKIILDNEKPILNIKNTIPKFTQNESIEIEGSTIGGDSLFINTQLVLLSNNKFNKVINLEEGNNNIEIVVKDKAGNVFRKTILIIKDSEPPKLLEYKITRDKKNKTQYLIKVTASDNSNLTKIAIANITINKIDRKVVLLLNGNNKYEKEIFTNTKFSDVSIKSIFLEDYIGNSKKYIIK